MQARQPPRRRQIHLGPRRDRDQLEPFGGAPPQLAVRMRDQRRAMADRAQAVDGQQHLVLAAAPGPRGVDVKREHYGARCGVRGARLLQLPELRELQEHVVGVHRRDDEAGHAVAEAAAGDVVAQEGERRMAGELQQAGAPAVLVHLPRGQRRVAVDRLEVLGDVAVGVVLDLAAQLPRRCRRPSPIRARSARSSARAADRRGAADSRDTSRCVRTHRPRCQVTRGMRKPRAAARIGERRADLGAPAPASPARRRRATGSSRGSPARRRSSSARCSPSQSWTTTRSVYRRAIATVSSVLCESTTTISSAQATDASAAPRSAASFLATTVTESFGTRGVY